MCPWNYFDITTQLIMKQLSTQYWTIITKNVIINTPRIPAFTNIKQKWSRVFFFNQPWGCMKTNLPENARPVNNFLQKNFYMAIISVASSNKRLFKKKNIKKLKEN